MNLKNISKVSMLLQFPNGTDKNQDSVPFLCGDKSGTFVIDQIILPSEISIFLWQESAIPISCVMIMTVLPSSFRFLKSSIISAEVFVSSNIDNSSMGKYWKINNECEKADFVIESLSELSDIL